MTDTPRKPKKSETLEVRLPYDTKREFLDACREDGTTASEVVRTSIDTYLGARERPEPIQETGKLLTMIPRPIRKFRYLAGAAGALGLAAIVVLPSAAGPDIKGAFARLDANKDGVLSADEFAGPTVSADGNLRVIEKHVVRSGEAKAEITVTPDRTEKAVTFWLGDEDIGPGGKSPDGKNPDGKGNVVVERREIRIHADAKDGADVKNLSVDIAKSDFERFDADKDGKVSFVEYEGRQRAMLEAGFDLLDRNKDKSLTLDEYGRIVAPMKITVSDSDGETLSEDLKPMMSDEKIAAHFAKLDKNGDKKLSLQEYLPPS